MLLEEVMFKLSLQGRVEIIQTKQRKGKLILGGGISICKDSGGTTSSPPLARGNCLTRVESEYL